MKKVLVLLFLLAAALTPAAMAQDAIPCADQVRILRILGDQVATSRNRSEAEAARTIVRLMNQVESLQAEIAALKQVK